MLYPRPPGFGATKVCVLVLLAFDSQLTHPCGWTNLVFVPLVVRAHTITVQIAVSTSVSHSRPTFETCTQLGLARSPGAGIEAVVISALIAANDILPREVIKTKAPLAMVV